MFASASKDGNVRIYNIYGLDCLYDFNTTGAVVRNTALSTSTSNTSISSQFTSSDPSQNDFSNISIFWINKTNLLLITPHKIEIFDLNSLKNSIESNKSIAAYELSVDHQGGAGDDISSSEKAHKNLSNCYLDSTSLQLNIGLGNYIWSYQLNRELFGIYWCFFGLFLENFRKNTTKPSGSCNFL